MKNSSLFLFLLAVLAMTACRREKLVVPEPVETEVSITLKTGQWTYYSLRDAEVVGYSLIGNAEEDEVWFNRTDWDVAFSESGIRTNSGTSGSGRGGVRLQRTAPDSLHLSEYEAYQYQFSDFVVDTLGVYTEKTIE